MKTQNIPKYVKLNGFYSKEVYYEIQPKEKNKGYISMHIPTWNNEIEHALQTFFVGDFSEIKVTPSKHNGYTLTTKTNYVNNLLNGLQLYKHIEGLLYSIYNNDYEFGVENTIKAPPSKIVSIEIIKEDLAIS
jgi:hypothetical protein